jgi:hypothetical protein
MTPLPIEPSTHGVELARWVAAADDRTDREFRQAVHTVLDALAAIPGTSEWIALKGAILLALRYDFTRPTRDVDLSTAKRLQDFDVQTFLSDLRAALPASVERLPYGLACRLQSHEIRPSFAGATFPTLRATVGYAPSLDGARMRRMIRGTGSAHTLTMDLSFNEPLLTLEWLDLGTQGPRIPAYSLNEFVAEKFRAILQQPGRKRNRPQDALDIDVLLATQPALHGADARTDILRILRAKSVERALLLSRGALRDPAVRQRSAHDYAPLAAQLPIALPPFEAMFERVTVYFESLPWPEEPSAFADTSQSSPPF